MDHAGRFERRHAAIVSWLCGHGSLFGGCTLRHPGRLSASFRCAACQGHEVSDRPSAQSYWSSASMGARPAYARLVSWHASSHRAVESDFYELVDPHAPRRAWRDITNGWFTDAMPDLNQENPLVSRYLIQNAMWWVETANLDGIRLDTFPYVSRAFWHDFHETLHGAYPHLTTVGEIFHRDPEVTSYFAGGITPTASTPAWIRPSIFHSASRCATL